MTDPHDYAGKYLRNFETYHYSFLERQAWLNRILVPAEAERFADVSFWQAGMDWEQYARMGRAVILRIGQNIWQDTEFEYNYAEAKRATKTIESTAKMAIRRSAHLRACRLHFIVLS